MVSVMNSKQQSLKKSKTLPDVEGPSNVMLGRQNTGPQKPGVSSQEQPEGKSSGLGAKGGTTKMFGYTGSKPAKPA